MAAAASAPKSKTIVIGTEGIIPISDRDNLMRLVNDVLKDGKDRVNGTAVNMRLIRSLNLFGIRERDPHHTIGVDTNAVSTLIAQLYQQPEYLLQTRQMPWRQSATNRHVVVGLGAERLKTTEIFYDMGRMPERFVDSVDGGPLTVMYTFGTYADNAPNPTCSGCNHVAWPPIGDGIIITERAFQSLGLGCKVTATHVSGKGKNASWTYHIEYSDNENDSNPGCVEENPYYDGGPEWKSEKDANDTYFPSNADKNYWIRKATNELGRIPKSGDYEACEVRSHILGKLLGDTLQVMLYNAWFKRHPDHQPLMITQDRNVVLLNLYYKAPFVHMPSNTKTATATRRMYNHIIKEDDPNISEFSKSYIYFCPTRDPMSRAKLEYRSTLTGIAANNKLVIDSVKNVLSTGWGYTNLKVGSKTVEWATIPKGFWRACLADLTEINKTLERRSLTPDQLLAKRPAARSKEDQIWALNKHAKKMKHKYHLMNVVAKDAEGENRIVIGTHWTQQYGYGRPNLDTYLESRLKMMKSMRVGGTMWDEVLEQKKDTNLSLTEWQLIMTKAYYGSKDPALRTAAYKEGAFENYTPIQSAGARLQEGGLGEEDEGGELIDYLAPIPRELIQNDGMSISFIQAIQQNQDYLKVPNLVDVVGFPEVDTSPMMYYCDPDMQPGDESYIPGCEGKGEVDLNAMYLSSIGEAVAELARRYPGTNIPTADDVYWWLYNTSLVFDMDQLIVTADYLEQAFIPHYWNLTPVDIELTDEVFSPPAAAAAAPAAAAPAPAQTMEVERPPTPEVRWSARTGMGVLAPRGFSPPPESIKQPVSALPKTTRSGTASKMRSVKHTRRSRAMTPRLSVDTQRPAKSFLAKAERGIEKLFAGGKRKPSKKHTRRKSKTKRTGKKRRTAIPKRQHRRRTQRKTRKQEKRK